MSSVARSGGPLAKDLSGIIAAPDEVAVQYSPVCEFTSGARTACKPLCGDIGWGSLYKKCDCIGKLHLAARTSRVTYTARVQRGHAALRISRFFFFIFALAQTTWGLFCGSPQKEEIGPHIFRRRRKKIWDCGQFFFGGGGLWFFSKIYVFLQRRSKFFSAPRPAPSEGRHIAFGSALRQLRWSLPTFGSPDITQPSSPIL